MSQASLIPVSLLTGFLGSGKTTVLNRIVRAPAMRRTLVIINEFGAIGIDHDLVTASDEEVVVEMTSGCLCCTIRGDLVRTLRDAPWRYSRDAVGWFDRVLIETTGLTDPIPILHTLMTDQRLAALYRLDSVITTVDAATGMATLDAQDESVRQVRQVAVADRLLLTKTDLVSAPEVAALRARLRETNPAAPLVEVVHGKVDPDPLFGAALYDPATKSQAVQAWLNAEAYETPRHERHEDGGSELGEHALEYHDHEHDAAHHDVSRHHDRIRSLCLTFDELNRTAAVDRWLDVLMMFKGRDVLRSRVSST